MIDGLLETLRKEQDAQLAHSSARARVEQRLSERMPRPRSLRWPWALAAAVLLVAGGAWALVPGSPIGYRVVVGRTSVGGFVDGAEGAELAFTDGSSVVLASDSAARVVALDARGATVELTRGALEAAVQHRSDTSWQVLAGPFVVHVTGTVFHVGWVEARAELEVAVSEGAVRVEGACLEAPRVVTSGRRVVLTCAGWAPIVEGGPRLTDDAAEPAVDDPPTETPRNPLTEPRPRTRAALEAGADSVVPEPIAEPVEPVIEPVDTAAWLDAAEHAAVAGDVAAAQRRLLDVRSHAAGSSDAAMAAFLLGRLAFDQQRDYAEAARWFTTYEAERPEGPLVREALGRRFEALERAGDASGARAQAERYLLHFPEGPHAGRARELLR